MQMNGTPIENVLSEQDRQVTVRLLPDGVAHAALLSGLNGQFLRIDLSPTPAEASLKTGDLVEVTCPKTLYLGEVCGRQDETIMVAVEHSLDRERLALIQQTWSCPVGQ